MTTTTQKCGCGCCGPVDDADESRTLAELERARLQAERRLAEIRLAELESQLAELEQPAR